MAVNLFHYICCLVMILCLYIAECGGYDTNDRNDRNDRNDENHGRISTVVPNDITTNMLSRHSSLFSKFEYINIKNKRIRREIRDLSMNEWNEIVDAMWIMKRTLQTDGELLYGSNFRNYDELVCKHMIDAMDPRGDQAHFGAHFPMWHHLYLLEFELSLFSINSNIKSVPYWNGLIDNNNPILSEIFGNKYFGSLKPNDTLLKDGKFAYWPINNLSSISNINPATNLKYCTNHVNPFGQLRGRISPQNSNYVVRYGNSLCDLEGSLINEEIYSYCLFNTQSQSEWQFCFDPFVHAQLHVNVGGSSDIYNGQPSSINDSDNINNIINSDFIKNYGFFGTESDWCMDWYFKLFNNNGLLIYAQSIETNCFQCLTSDQCIIGQNTSYQCQCNITNNDNTCEFNNQTISLLPREYSPLFGDFVDSASPNDPIFMFHHSNMDRYWQHWLLEKFELKNDYWKYPDYDGMSNLNYGGKLNDIISDLYPFKNVLNNVIGNNGPYTAKDVFDSLWTNSEYTYDTIIDAIKPSFNIPDACISDPCDESEAGQCFYYKQEIGCEICKKDYFKIDYHYPCVSCDYVFNNNCKDCTNFNGCKECKNDNKLDRKQDPITGLWYCQPKEFEN